MNINIQQLEKMTNLLQQGVLSQKDIVSILKIVQALAISVAKQIADNKKEMSSVASSSILEIKKMVAEAKGENKKMSTNYDISMKHSNASVQKEIKKLQSLIEKFESIEISDGEDGKDGSPDTPFEVRDKLESLQEGDKLSIQAIEGLSKLLEELSKKPTVSGGVAFGGGRVRFIDDATLIGTVDGSNATFKVAKTPATGSLKIYRGGARQRITEDYTFDGYRTVVFTIAPQVGEVILYDLRY